MTKLVCGDSEIPHLGGGSAPLWGLLTTNSRWAAASGKHIIAAVQSVSGSSIRNRCYSWHEYTHCNSHPLHVDLRHSKRPCLAQWQSSSALRRSMSRRIIGVKISCIAKSILPPGHTIVLGRDMNES
ncbi:Uncharacterised protein [Mycobacterium xenopi]|nr:Uncharacterised protein [Mycobacterium xenopi]